MSLVIISGWIAFFAFAGMIATCICAYGCECRMAKKTKTKCDDYIVSRMHSAHKWFVWFAAIAVITHVLIVGLR